MAEFPKLAPIHDVDIAFGSIENLPPFDSLPKEYRDESARGCEIAAKIFFRGGTVADFGSPRPEATQDDIVLAVRSIKAILSSFEPKHEHKIAGVGWLIDQFFMPDAKDAGS